jgi:hypothetical protein
MELIADIPGFYRELGGEQDVSDLGFTWQLPKNIAYYKTYFHDPPEIGTHPCIRAYARGG